MLACCLLAPEPDQCPGQPLDTDEREVVADENSLRSENNPSACFPMSRWAASESKFGCLCVRCFEKTIDDGLSIYKNGICASLAV